MANPTSAFGWQMPTSTDLVTDLPADFETFGQAVDTSLADLKGGTTGQVLSKASNTDMDFTWVTSDDANAIQNTIVDAKGDLISATGADTPARLAVGANDLLLTAASGEATGLKYTGAWTTYTPTYTNLTIGNGTVTARYCQIGKVVVVFWSLTWGSTTSTGSYPFVSLPIATVNAGYVAGNMTQLKLGTGFFLGSTYIDNTGMLLMPTVTNGNYAIDGITGATSPATWVTGDSWTTTATYQVA